MTDEKCRDSAFKTNRLLEDINIQLASLNLILWGYNALIYQDKFFK
jgi:hypothetical protein